jgi:hypothetical protein
MLNPLFTFFIFYVASLATRVIIMTYYPQYTYFAHVLSSLLISIGMAFSIPFMKPIISRLPKLSPKMNRWFKMGFVILVFITTFLISYYKYMPQSQ